MGFIQTVKRWFNMIFLGKAKEEFEIESISSTQLDRYISKCADIYRGKPDWIDKENHIKTVNFAKTLCEEVARLSTLAIGVTIDGSTRAEYLQKMIDDIYFSIRQWVEYGAAFGTIILKPNESAVDVVLPDKYIITAQTNGKVKGAVFVNQQTSADGRTYWTRLEYHRRINDLYVITNRCFKGISEGDVSTPVAIEKTPWNGLEEETAIANLDGNLYAVLKMPNANTIDIGSPISMSIFAGAIEELKDLDVAYSRNAKEIYDSKRTVLVDSDRLVAKAGKLWNTADGRKQTVKEMGLPDYVAIVEGTGTQDEVYHEINPSLNTDERIKGINNILSQIGLKCGFSNGYFVFDEKTGMVTATQVEADDRRTIQLIKDVRDQLEACITELVYALDKMADLYTDVPAGAYEITFDFGDITYNREEDRTRWWSYVQSGKVPAWMYFNKFEGMSEEDAKLMVAEAQPKESGLFEDE